MNQKNESSKKVVITGGAGFVGSVLSRHLLKRGYEVVSLDIRPSSVSGVRSVQANLLEPIDKRPELEHPYAYINLAGNSIFGRWSETKKRLIYETRIDSTEHLVELFEDQGFRPEAFVSASAAGYFGDQKGEWLAPDGEPGQGFLATVCRDWENAATDANRFDITTTIIRNGHVLGDGGLLGVLKPIYQFGLGGPLGDGQQWFSWIHVDDLCRFYLKAIEHPDDCPPVLHGVSASPVRQGNFSGTLADVLNRPHVFRIPQWALSLLFRDFAKEVCFSQRLRSSAPVLDDELDYSSLTVALSAIL